MKKLHKNDEKGFTLAELLIVVAIIAVLVAVSIPIFNSKLEKSREATDVANMRAAYAAGVAACLGEEKIADNKTAGVDASVECYYDAGKGKLVSEKPSQSYGKGTSAKGGIEAITIGNLLYNEDLEVKEKCLKVVIVAGTENNITLSWE